MLTTCLDSHKPVVLSPDCNIALPANADHDEQSNNVGTGRISAAMDGYPATNSTKPAAFGSDFTLDFPAGSANAAAMQPNHSASSEEGTGSVSGQQQKALIKAFKPASPVQQNASGERS